MQLRDFIPPIIRMIARRSRPPALKEYRSYDEALAESDGYEAPDIAEVVLRKTEIYRDLVTRREIPKIDSHQTLQNLFVLSFVQPDRALHVLELGGACGANFFELAHLLPGRIASWRIVETPGMATRAREALHHPALSFFDNVTEAVAEMESRDLLIAQGVLQYLPAPLKKFEEYLALHFEHVYVSRTLTLTDTLSGDEVVIFNSESRLAAHGPGPMPSRLADRRVTTPCTLVADKSLMARFPVHYRELFWFNESEPQLLDLGSRVVESGTIGFLLGRNRIR
jgi:putative methyltransferase (TIGR04325 family)